MGDIHLTPHIRILQDSTIEKRCDNCMEGTGIMEMNNFLMSCFQTGVMLSRHCSL